MTSIGDYAFEGCNGLASVTIPESVTSIGFGAFPGVSFEVLVGNPKYMSISGMLLTKDGRTLVQGVDGDVTIPDSVTSIGEGAFYDCSGLTSVTIPDSVTSIGVGAFYGCSGLTSMTIPDGVASIGNEAFSGCSGLTSVTIPDSVTSIGEGAFKGCNDSLFDTTTIQGVKLVDGWAIGHTDSLPDSLDLAGVRGIGPFAFHGCTNLTSVTMPDSVTSIGRYTFGRCSNLTSVTIPDSVTSIGERAFYDCSGLTSVTIPGSVTSIGDSAFSGCSGLTSVTIGAGVTSIGIHAFWGCSGLTSVTMPDSVTVIEDGAFRYCTGLTNVVLSAKLKNLGYTSFRGEEAIGVFEGCSGLRSILLPNALERIGAASFSYCERLTSVTIPGSVTSIGGRAFWKCSGLMSVTIPDSVTSIGEGAFEDCSGLTSVTIGNSVVSIGYGAFVDCSGLTSLVFEGNAPSVGSYTFSGVNSSCVAYVHRGSTWWGVEIPGMWYGLRIEYIEDMSPDIWTVTFDANGGELADGDSSRQVEVGTPIGELPVPSRSDYAFLGWFTAAEGGEQISSATIMIGDATYYAHWTETPRPPDPVSEPIWTIDSDGVLTKVDLNGCTDIVIPDSVTSIGEEAFYGSSGLTSVTIPDSVTSIWWDAFRDCSGLTNVVIGSGVTSIWSGAFSYCSGLTSVTIPDGVTSIGGSAFSGCSGLTSVTIPDSVTSIGERAFYNCSGLMSFVVGDGNSTYKSVGGLLLSNDGTTLIAGVNGDVTIPDGVTSIGEYAFYNCSGLTSVTIPDSVTSIGDGAFTWCGGLTNIVFEGNAPSVGSSTFSGVKSGCVVYVPRGSTGWGVEIPGIWNGMRIEYAEDASPDVWTVTFDANGGELVDGDSSRQVENGTPLGELPVPSRLDYTFLGWFTSAEGGDRVTAETAISDDVALYAHWRCLFEGSWTQEADGVWSSGETIDDSEKPLTMAVEGAGTVTFRWKVSCEDYFVFRTQKILCDHLTFRIDGEEQALINADTDWTECSFAVAGGGRHTLAWVYVKDSEGSDGEDCAWLDGVSWVPSEVANVSVDADKGEIEKTDAGYVVTAKDGMTLTEGDFTFGAIAKAAYKIEIAEDGKSATVTLAEPQIGVAEEASEEMDEDDATGLLVVVDESKISAKPEAKAGEKVGALPVKTYPGLFYQVSWGDDLGGLTTGEKVQATDDGLYLGVIKQIGSKGFYKLSVSEE